ncbi:MAG TPA: NUDIX hydrolase [Candidatus Dormibacteraeota bacterium]|jgi:8-oxo-dGTP diphosphatase
MPEATVDSRRLMDEALAAHLELPEVVRAAGGVVYRLDAEGSPEVVMVHRPAYDDWSLPKGKLKLPETLEAGALREVAEETGMTCLIERCLGVTRYIDRRGRDKVVWYWLMRAHAGEFRPLAEVDMVRWCDVVEAMATLSYAHDRDILLRANLGT